MMKNQNDIITQVDQIYQWIDDQLQAHPQEAGQCHGCGDCCNFEAYDHRLYVTSAEMVLFRHHRDQAALQEMKHGTCPYQRDKRCTVHPHRFAGCRIFCCTGSDEFQNELSEQVVAKLKQICRDNDLPYAYMDLKTALKSTKD